MSSKFFLNINNKAFTLIELLVVISIISILSTIILVSTSDTRAKGRDTKRISDISELRIALELYYANNDSNYPTSVNLGSLKTQSLIGQVPKDPSTNLDYFYKSDGNRYHLGAKLESSNAYLLSDHDKSGSGISGDFAGRSVDCVSAIQLADNLDNQDKCYDIYR